MTGLLTLAGALAVALITAFTTDRRLSRQIRDERERQERSLTAEAERQAATLAHDRELTDLADLRNLLDEAGLALQGVRRDAMAAKTRAGLFHDESFPRDARQQLVDDTHAKLAESAPLIDGLTARLRVRLGFADPITMAFSDAQRSLSDMTVQAALLLNLDSHGEADERQDALKDATDGFRVSSEEFFVAAVGRAGTVLIGDGAEDGSIGVGLCFAIRAEGQTASP